MTIYSRTKAQATLIEQYRTDQDIWHMEHRKTYDIQNLRSSHYNSSCLTILSFVHEHVLSCNTDNNKTN